MFRFPAVSTIIVLLGFLTIFALSKNSTLAVVEAQSPQRFQFQSVGKWGWNGDLSSNQVYYKIATICDTATGTLIYSSGTEAGIWGVPNGCQKSPR